MLKALLRAAARFLLGYDHDCQHPFRGNVCVQCGECHCGK